VRTRRDGVEAGESRGGEIGREEEGGGGRRRRRRRRRRRKRRMVGRKRRRRPCARQLCDGQAVAKK